ncbi:MAG: hypothetical protein V1899_00415 [Planctomycetota bacterium]
MAIVPAYYLKRRDFLHSEKTSPNTLSAAGCELLAVERYSDALDFFEKARDTDGIQKIKRIALQHGDTFLLARLDRFDRTLVTKEDWEVAAKSASVNGKASMAEFMAKKFAPPPVALGATPTAVLSGEKPGEAPLAEV